MNEKVVVVTGGGRGIGRAVCLRFAREGAQVVPVARSPADLEQTRILVEQAGGQCSPQRTDVGHAGDVRELLQSVDRLFGRIDVLVNNAGVAVCAPVMDITVDQFEQMLRIHVAAVFYASQAVLPIMKRQRAGTIVNISSMAAADPYPGLGTYGAAKAWINAFTKGLAAEVKPDDIGVFAVGPGAVETAMLRESFPDFPAGQALSPDDVANAVYALTNREMFHATGQTIYVTK